MSTASSEDEFESSLNISYESLQIPIKEAISEDTLANDKRLIKNEETMGFKSNFFPDYFSLSLEEFNNNLNEDISEGEFVNRTVETNLDEIYEGLTYFITGERNKIINEKENLKSDVKTFLDFCKNERDKMQKLKEKFMKSKSIADEIANKSDIIEVKIKDWKCLTTKQTLCKYAESKIAKLVQRIFTNFVNKNDNNLPLLELDRSPETFNELICYLRTGKLSPLLNDDDYNSVIEELIYWEIPLTDNLKNKGSFTFDINWCAKTLKIDLKNSKTLHKFENQHGIVFCTPCLSEDNPYIEFKIKCKILNKTKNLLYIGLVDKSQYKIDNLLSTLWKDSPSSCYWDVWNSKLIRTNDKGVLIENFTGYGKQCHKEEFKLGIRYDSEEQTVTFYRDSKSCGVAFRGVEGGMNPSLDLWFKDGTVEILNDYQSY